MRIWQVLWALGIAILLSSCPQAGADSQPDPEHWPRSGSSSFSFDYQTDTVRGAGELVAANELVVLDTSTLQLYRTPLLPGRNSFAGAEPERSYLIGFVHNPGRAGPAGSRSISDAISLIGGFEVVTGDMDTLPVGTDPDQEVDLGTVVPDGETFGSDASAETISDGLDHDAEALEAYWGMDQSLVKLLNPDVNANGVYDVDEEYSWELRADFLFDADVRALHEAESGTVADSAWIDQNGMIIYWRIVDPVDAADWNEIRLRLPPEYAIEADGVPVEYAPAKEFPGAPGEYDYPYFNFWLDYDWSPPPPYAGTYVVEIGSQSYEIRHVEFFRPESGYEGLPFPTIAWTANADGDLLELEGRYVVMSDGTVRDATPQELSMILTRASVDIGLPDDVIPSVSVEMPTDRARFTVDVASLGLTIETHGLGMPAWGDVAGNQYQMNFTNPPQVRVSQ